MEGCPDKVYISSWNTHLELIMQSLLFGLLFGVINTILERIKLSRKSFAIIVIIKLLIYILSLAVIGMIHNFVFYRFNLLDELTYSKLS